MMRFVDRLPALLLLPLLALNMPLHADALDDGPGLQPLDEIRYRSALEHWTRELQDALAADPRAMASALRLLLQARADLLQLRAEAVAPDTASPLDLQADFDRAFAAAREQNDLPALHLLRAATACHPRLQERGRNLQRWMEQMDTDNLAVHLGALRPCGRDPAEGTAQAILARAAQSGQFNVYRAEIAAGLGDLIAQTPPPPALLETLAPTPMAAEDAPTLLAIGWVLGLDPMPGTQLYSFCRTAADTLLADCRSIAGRLAHSPWLIDRLPALGLLQKLAEDEDERAQAAQERRRLHWWMAASGQLEMENDDRLDRDPAAIARARRSLELTLDSWRSGRGEIDALRDYLLAAGVALEPPAEWQAMY